MPLFTSLLRILRILQIIHLHHLFSLLPHAYYSNFNLYFWLMPVFVLFVHLILIHDASSALNLVGPILVAEFKSEEKVQPITFNLDQALILDAIQP